MINKGILKYLEKKEVMVIDEDPFPPMASINILAVDLRAMLSAKKNGTFSPSVRIRKAWITKQYLTYKNYMVAEKGVSAIREKKK